MNKLHAFITSHNWDFRTTRCKKADGGESAGTISKCNLPVVRRLATFEINKRAMGKIRRGGPTKAGENYEGEQPREWERETESGASSRRTFRWKSEIQLISQSHSRRCNYDYYPPPPPARQRRWSFSINSSLPARASGKQRLPDLNVLRKYLTRPTRVSKLRIRVNWI